MIPTKIHGVLDYLMGAFLIAIPWLFGFHNNGAQTWVPVVLGIAVIVYSLLTDYELGVAPVISMVWHLRLDAGSGLLLAVSPFVFGFQDLVYWPHLILGLLEVAASQLTHRVPAYGPNHRQVSPGHGLAT
jgi:hypothetical protein